MASRRRSSTALQAVKANNLTEMGQLIDSNFRLRRPPCFSRLTTRLRDERRDGRAKSHLLRAVAAADSLADGANDHASCRRSARCSTTRAQSPRSHCPRTEDPPEQLSRRVLRHEP